MHPDELLQSIELAAQQMSRHQRLLVGIVGAPASGKSTLAQWLVTRINADETKLQRSVVVPMDGFHLDNSMLEQQKLLAVKGAPHTFDVVGLKCLIERLAAPLLTGESTATNPLASSIYIPVFDREQDLARCAGSAVETHHSVIILEGNYLLLQRPVWCELAQYLNLTVFLDVPEDVLEQRLVQRWLAHGLSQDKARERALSNDIPNAHVVIRESTAAQVTLKSVSA